VARQAPAPAKPAAPAGDTFAHLRERMIALTRAESWSEAARLLIAMKGAASGDRELATVYRDLGDFARSQGQMDDAAEAYDTAVSHARDALRAAPGDLNAMELLAGTLAGVGDVAEAEGRLDDALSAFEESLALRRSSGGREAGDPGAQRALSVSLERLADLREDRGHRMRALDLYRESYDVAARLAAADPARFGSDLALTRQRLAELEAKIST
jgi:tetratricopeptide (TPR) repeat protein